MKAGNMVGIYLRPHDLRRHAATYASRIWRAYWNYYLNFARKSHIQRPKLNFQD
jgi:hypothetical protein